MSSTIESPAVLARRAGSAKGSESGIWIALFAITMSFAAFTSALFIRQASSDWTHIAAPRVLFASTAVLLLSSLMMEASRRELDGSRAPKINEHGRSLAFVAA